MPNLAFICSQKEGSRLTMRCQSMYNLQGVILTLWPCPDYSQIFNDWVEVKATRPTGKLELLTLELHPPTRRWESVNPPAGS
jgi:hypothetical protein